MLCNRETTDSAKEEFGTLLALTQHFEKLGHQYTVPTPFAILPDLSGLLMSRVDGRRLDKILWPAFSFNKEQRTDAIEGVRDAGVWLANLQKNSYHPSPHSLSVLELKSELDASLGLCKGLLGPGVIDAIAQWSKKEFEASSRLNCDCVPICPSFVPHHVFISEGRTSVVDLERQDCGWPGIDLASFLVYAEMHGSMQQQLTINEICDNFLAAYASEIEFGPCHRLSLEANYIMNLLELFRPLQRPETANSERRSWIETHYARWKARSARHKLLDRTRTRTWKSIISE